MFLTMTNKSIGWYRAEKYFFGHSNYYFIYTSHWDLAGIGLEP